MPEPNIINILETNQIAQYTWPNGTTVTISSNIGVDDQGNKWLFESSSQTDPNGWVFRSGFQQIGEKTRE